jgi:acetoin utilization deacetylase AcuC-like enzyme
MIIVFSPKCLEYHQPGHPESPDRISRTQAVLEEQGYRFTAPKPASEKDILRVHTRQHLASVKQGALFDQDSPALPFIHDFALLSAGAAMTAALLCREGKNAFSLMRPPGHHATRNRAMGFCYYNNIAVASAHLLARHPGDRAAILDIDCHHGNGTESIFLGHPSVFFVSLHQSPLYPGSGLKSVDNALNIPLPPGTGDDAYLDALEHACKAVGLFDPDWIGVSAGFDTYRDDPIAQMDLTLKAYSRIGERIAGLAKPVFIVMEGGYGLDLPACVAEFLRPFP